jgi:hypothetical protein
MATKVSCNALDCVNNKIGLCQRRMISLVNMAGAEDLFNCKPLRWNKQTRDMMKHKPIKS